MLDERQVTDPLLMGLYTTAGLQPLREEWKDGILTYVFSATAVALVEAELAKPESLSIRLHHENLKAVNKKIALMKQASRK